MKRPAALCAAALLFCAADATARPDLRRPVTAGPLVLYPDDAHGNIYYYAPGELAVATVDDSRPDLHFLHVRYTGSVTTGDRGRELFRSLLSFRVVLSGPSAAEILAAKRAIGTVAEVRPMPIRRLDTVLVYTPLENPGEAVDAPAPKRLDGGHAQPADGTSSPAGQYWTERVYSLLLGADDAQLLSEAIDRGRVAISVGYAFYADGIAPDVPIDDLRGSPELVNGLRETLAKSRKSAVTDSPSGQLVRAGALGITVDVSRWPEAVRRIDAGASAPPGYAFLDVYCYDFNNELRPDLYEKQVEIEAQGVAGRPVTLLTVFQRGSPDVYVRTLRFQAAVRLDRPYRYRILEVTPDGSIKEGAWRVRESWAQHLDVTGETSIGGGLW